MDINIPLIEKYILILAEHCKMGAHHSSLSLKVLLKAGNKQSFHLGMGELRDFEHKQDGPLVLICLHTFNTLIGYKLVGRIKKYGCGSLCDNGL